MDWKGRRQSDNIEDERGSSPTGGGPLGGGGFRFPGGGLGGGGLSFRTIIVLVVIFLALRAMGVDVIGLLQQSGALTGGSTSGSGYQQSDNSGGTAAPANDEMKQFVATVLADTEDTWTGIFKSMGQTYTDPKLVLFSGRFPSACGTASAATGPFYCPSDQKVYLDMAFFQQMKDQFGASGDFAQAYVIAHEVGHHVQDQLGILPKFNQARQTMNEVDANKMSVRIELQADCFAGIWGKFTQQKGILQQGDLEEALNAAQQIGDDTLQKRSQGYVVPDSFNHGTSAQRMKWFKQGFDSGKLSDCDTLNNPV
ncbi:neutral zinc metallopeptidase [Agrobacterium rhizogenes]|uniref:KPN_02809 family neutral zinc metallopeptidase n=1 Tax=Rhizobium rhizogenes TaxID=359 RepID=UPI00080FAE66|nr:neutral zinc metallopeptidase [Rhizobium rhizogenes]KAA6490163.1 neutral zinc metallopeptidase [Agrobacterium sp. ICMP 7243]OCJ14752.1 flagellar biosynthesis protein FlgM [Agrobacterium sp. B133/95]NTF49122.1 neutral zinc metallopeptidase [Rhizobium rhizogenes]NTG01010.1 neutral zinc metallopeptidase [Rhizobium rhizogenes]NTG14439.1 neutral zinc metallopeptidase [Rhizobium rhizogenes]